MSNPRPPRDIALLRRNGQFRRFWIARTVSHVGDGAALVALILYAKNAGRSGTAVGALLLAQSIPHVAAPLAGVLTDRVDRKWLMISCDVLQAAIFGAIAWWLPPLPPLVGLVVVTSSLDTMFGPAGQSAVPGLVPSDDLLEANAWTATSLNLQVAIGPIVGGALVGAFGIRWALMVNAASFLGSAIALAGLPALPASVNRPHSSLWGDAREGLAVAWSSRVVRAVLFALLFGVSFAAVDNVALVFMVRDTLGGGPLAFGIATGAFGLGMVIGSLAISMRRRRIAPVRFLLLSWLLSGIGTLATGLSPNQPAVVGAQAISGIGNGIDLVAVDTIVQQAIPPPALGRVFGLVATAAFAGSSVAYVLGALLLDLTTPRAVFLIAGAGVLAVWIALMAMVRGASGSSSTLGAGAEA